MARPLRIEYNNAFYHITVRGNARGVIYQDDFDREMFLSVVAEAYNRFGFHIHAFVLMDNHYHLLIETPQANLSASMRHINGVYTQLYNKRHKLVGHLFQGRYKAIVVNRDEYYLSLIRYIHRNPMCTKKPVQLNQFKYSGHMAIIDKKWRKKWHKWYHAENILKEFGAKESRAIKNYKDYVNEKEKQDSLFKNVIGGYALGSRDFTNWLWNSFIDGKDEREIIGIKVLKPNLELKTILAAISKVLGVKASNILSDGRSKNGSREIRGLALYILSKQTGFSQKTIGDMANGISRNAVSESVRRFEQELKNKSEVKKMYNKILKVLL